MSVAHKSESLSIVSMLSILLFSCVIAWALWSCSPEYRQSVLETWQHSQANLYTPKSDTRFYEALNLSASVHDYIARFFAAFVVLLGIFFGLLFANRKNAKNAVTQFFIRHRQKVLATIMVLEAMFLIAAFWIYVYPMAIQHSILINSLARLHAE